MFFQMDIGMVEFLGLIKVDIIRGTDLAVRDVMSSDPYVMIILGHQVSTFSLVDMPAQLCKYSFYIQLTVSSF